MHKFVKQALVLATITLSGLFLYKTTPERVQHLEKTYNTFKAPPLSYLSKGMINVMTLGHKHVYDDFINIWLLQALINPSKTATPQEAIEGIRAVIRHEPALESLYMLSCIAMFDEYKSPQYCQEITLKGLEAFPTSWRLPMLQGYVHAFSLNEPAQAASFFLMASSRTKAPPWVKRLVNKLLDKKDINRDDLDRSMQILEQAPNSGAFKEILKRMRNKMSQPKEDS